MYSKIFKRFFDFTISLILILLLTPILLLVAFFIALDSKGPVIFSQDRVGKNGRVFTIYKFRTMLSLEDSYSKEGRELENYERVTKVGQILRKTSLDEVLQLINVLKNEMSIIGPRPTLPYQAERYDEIQKRRLDVRPGLTGLAQVNGRNSLTWEEKIDFDLTYVEKLSFYTDIGILLRTPMALFGSEDNIFTKHDQISVHEGDFRDDI